MFAKFPFNFPAAGTLRTVAHYRVAGPIFFPPAGGRRADERIAAESLVGFPPRRRSGRSKCGRQSPATFAQMPEAGKTTLKAQLAEEAAHESAIRPRAVAASDNRTFLEKLRPDEQAGDFFLRANVSATLRTMQSRPTGMTSCPARRRQRQVIRALSATRRRKERVAEIRSVRLPPTRDCAACRSGLSHRRAEASCKRRTGYRRFVRRRRNAELMCLDVRIENWRRAPESGREVEEDAPRLVLDQCLPLSTPKESRTKKSR